MEAEIGARVRARMKERLPTVTQAEMASRIDLSPDAFSRSLSGKRSFTAVELVGLAAILDTSAHWFVSGEPDPFAVKVAGRHTYDFDTQAPSMIDWDAEAGPLDLIARVYIQAYGGEPPLLPTHDERSADAVRGQLANEFGPHYVRFLADAIEQVLGIDVVRVDGISRAFALEVLGRQIIVLGETGNWFYENFSLAHELFHVFRGQLSEKGSSTCDDPVAEAGANGFAADFLLPRDALGLIDWSAADEAAVAEFVWTTGVSTDTLARRLSAVGVRSLSAGARSALSDKTQKLLRRAWRSDTPGDQISERMQAASARRFPPHLLSAHRDGVERGLLRATSLAWMLGVEEQLLADELAPPLLEPDLDWLAKELGLD